MSQDPRNRGVCPVGYPPTRIGVPRPSKNPCTGKVLVANFHKGQKVLYRGVERTIYGVNHYFMRPTCTNLVSQRIVATLNLGPKDSEVPWYAVDPV